MAQQKLKLVKSELRRLEHDLDAKEQELRNAIVAKDSPRIIGDIRKSWDELLNERRGLHRTLCALLVQLVSPTGEVLAAAQ